MVKSEILILSDRVILNVITDEPFTLVEKISEFFRKNNNNFPVSGRLLFITENTAIELGREVFKTLFQIPYLTITVSDGTVGAELVSFKVNTEEVFNLI